MAVEATTGPAPKINPNAVAAKPPPLPSRGKVRVTVHAEAYNYTDRAILLQIEHNMPRVQDSTGKNLTPVTGELAARGTTGSKFKGTAEGLKAAGTLEIVESFDVNPGQTGLRFDWNLGSAGEAKATLP